MAQGLCYRNVGVLAGVAVVTAAFAGGSIACSSSSSGGNGGGGASSTSTHSSSGKASSSSSSSSSSSGASSSSSSGHVDAGTDSGKDSGTSSSSSSGAVHDGGVEHVVDDFTGTNTWAVTDNWVAASDGGTIDAGPDPLTTTIVGVDGGPYPKALQVTTNGTLVPGWSNVYFAFGPTVDATNYAGLTFWAKGTSTINVSLVEANEYQDATAIALTSTWTQYHLPFSAFKQPAWVTVDGGPFNPAVIHLVQFDVGAAMASDYQIAEVGFY